MASEPSSMTYVEQGQMKMVQQKLQLQIKIAKLKKQLASIRDGKSPTGFQGSANKGGGQSPKLIAIAGSGHNLRAEVLIDGRYVFVSKGDKIGSMTVVAINNRAVIVRDGLKRLVIE